MTVMMFKPLRFPHTIDGSDKQSAAFAAVILGGGEFGLYLEDGSCVMPPFEEATKVCDWWKEVFGEEFDRDRRATPEESLALAYALETVVSGTFKDRELYDAATQHLSHEDALAFKLKCTVPNPDGLVIPAARYAQSIRAKTKAKMPQPVPLEDRKPLSVED